MDYKRWNQLIRAVNDGDPAESINPPLNGEEKTIYENMERELSEMRKEHPEAAFSPVESDY